jgi:hypothetical protein
LTRSRGVGLGAGQRYKGESSRLDVLRDLDERRLTTAAAHSCWGSSTVRYIGC